MGGSSNRESAAPKAHRVRRASGETPALSAHRARAVSADSPAPSARRDRPVSEARKDRPVSLGVMLSASAVRWDPLVHVGFKVQQESAARAESVARLAHEARKVCPDHVGTPVGKARVEYRDCLDPQDRQVPVGQKAATENAGLEGQQDHRFTMTPSSTC